MGSTFIGPPSPLDNANTHQAALSKYWADQLTDLQRSAWATLASEYAVPNMFGEIRNLSGFGMFLHANWLTALYYGWPAYNRPYIDPPPMPNPPSSWPTLADPGVTIIAMTQIPLGRYASPFTAFNVTWSWTWTGPLPFPFLVFYLGEPGRRIDARRQGALTPAFFYRLFPGPVTYASFNMYVRHPLGIPGQTITVATKTHNRPNGGESPMAYSQQEIQPWPPPPPPEDDG